MNKGIAGIVFGRKGILLLGLAGCTAPPPPPLPAMPFELKEVRLPAKKLPGMPMDAFFTGPDLVITRLDPDDPKRATAVPLRWLERRRGSWTEKTTSLRAVHARHLEPADLNGDGRAELVLADHGPDVSPFPGGRSKILSSDGKNVPLPSPPAFTYHHCALDANRDGKTDLLQMNLSEEGEAIRVLVGDGKGKLREEKRWLENKLPPHCYMSCLVRDLDGDGDPEVVLGGCDRNEGNETPRDVLLKRAPSGRYAYVGDLPKRAGGDSWGTAHILAGNFRKGLPSLALATHNFGFTKGTVQVLRNEGSLQFEEIPFPYTPPPGNSFVPWLAAGDVNGDGLDDLLVVSRGLQQEVRLYIAGETGFRESPLPPLPGPFVSGAIRDYDGDGKNEIVLARYSEDLLVLERKD